MPACLELAGVEPTWGRQMLALGQNRGWRAAGLLPGPVGASWVCCSGLSGGCDTVLCFEFCLVNSNFTLV